MSWDYTPTYRGFDSFLGYYGGAIYYYEHTASDNEYSGYDMRKNTEEHDEPQRFSLRIWHDHAISIINKKVNSGDEKPFFLYIGWQGSHSPSQWEDEFYQIYSSNEVNGTDHRLGFQSQTTQTDVMIDSIVSELKRTNEWENTLFVFCSDNGAHVAYGDNSPLRGGKFTIWEGGVRLPAFITGGYLSNHLRGKTFDSYPLHVTDWYKTLLSACGLNIVVNSQEKENDTAKVNILDGEDLWDLLQTATRTTTEIYNYALGDEMNSINDEYIIKGGFDAKRDLYDSNLYDTTDDHDLNQLLLKTDKRKMLINVDSLSCQTEICGSMIYGGRWKILYGGAQLDQFGSTSNLTGCGWERTFENSSNDILGCGPIPSNANSSCYCAYEVCLFDLLNDPCEYYNVADKYQDITLLLYGWLKEYYDIQVTSLQSAIGQVSNTSITDPTNLDGTTGWWKPWSHNKDWTTLKFEVYLADFRIKNNDNNQDNTDAVLSLQNIKNKNHYSYFIIFVAIGIIFIFACMYHVYYTVFCKDCARGNDCNYYNTGCYENTVNVSEMSPLVGVRIQYNNNKLIQYT